MATKVTSKELNSTMTELLLNGYHHLQCIDKEIKSLDIKDIESATEDQKNKLHAMTMTFVLINDLLHPAHKLSKKLLPKEYLPLIESYMKRQRVSFEQKLIDECFCLSCKEDKNEASSNKNDTPAA
jgi:hypothetical protein